MPLQNLLYYALCHTRGMVLAEPKLRFTHRYVWRVYGPSLPLFELEVDLVDLLQGGEFWESWEQRHTQEKGVQEDRSSIPLGQEAYRQQLMETSSQENL